MTAQNAYLSTMEVWANIYLYRSFSAYFDYLKNTDISMQQAFALTYIHYNGPSKISELCTHMMVSAAAASQMVDRLEKRDLVLRVADSHDRRVRNVVLTAAGATFVQRSIAARQSWLKQLPEDLSEGQLDQISAALQLLIESYQQPLPR